MGEGGSSNVLAAWWTAYSGTGEAPWAHDYDAEAEAGSGLARLLPGCGVEEGLVACRTRG